MGRYLIWAAALVLAVTAALHAGGLQMVDRWSEGLAPFEASALRFVWISDSIDWTVAAILWVTASWKQSRSWLAAAGIVTLIPLAGAIGVMRIDPSFFGGQMLLGSVVAAVAGIILSWRRLGERG